MKTITKEHLFQRLHFEGIKKSVCVFALGALLLSPTNFYPTAFNFVSAKAPTVQGDSVIQRTQNYANTAPTLAEIKTRLTALDTYFCNIDEICRIALPKHSKSIKINIMFETTQAQQNLLNEAISEFNNIFAIINPAFCFEMNYNPTQKDLESIYNITLQKVDSFENPKMLGLTTSIKQDILNDIDGKELHSHTIQIKESVLFDSNKLSTVIKHELMHTLGAPDNYEQSNTIMQQLAIDDNITHLTKNDIMFLSAFYLNDNSIYTQEDIYGFANTYELNNAFMWSASKQKHYQEFCLDKLNSYIQNLDKHSLTDLLQSHFSSKYDTAELDQLIESLNKANFVVNQNLFTNFGELTHKSDNSSIHKYIKMEENSLLIHNYRDIDPSQITKIYHFENKINNITQYQNLFGNEETAFVQINDYVLQLNYEISENNQVQISPTNLYKMHHNSETEYASTLFANTENFVNLSNKNEQTK